WGAVGVVRRAGPRPAPPSRLDAQRIRALLDARAEAAQLLGDGGEAVRLLHAKVRDVDDLHRLRRQRRDGGERRDEVGRGVAVEAAAAKDASGHSRTI